MLGGALGSAARFAVLRLTEGLIHGSHVALATLLVNIAGSFLISLIAELAAAKVLGGNARIFLSIGVMGGLTTYSSFNHVVLEYLDTRQYGYALMNVALTVVLCLSAGMAGLAGGRWLTGEGPRMTQPVQSAVNCRQ